MFGGADGREDGVAVEFGIDGFGAEEVVFSELGVLRVEAIGGVAEDPDIFGGVERGLGLAFQKSFRVEVGEGAESSAPRWRRGPSAGNG